MANRVDLIDPNKINNDKFINGTQPYEDMHIFVKFLAQRRRNTILEGLSFTGKYSKITNLSEGNVISFLGENQQDPQNMKFTTNWYEGSTPRNEVQYEGFGINRIKILTNSSYIPQVDIEFMDVRGVAFFNKEDSPYRMLFDFPPPIFYLTFKGYYGKALTYQLHLVKYTTAFKAETGSFVINAKFIAISYAPLTDILFRHLIQINLTDMKGLSEDGETLTLNNNSIEPVNTLDLIKRLKMLYYNIQDKISNNIYNQAYEVKVNNIKKIDDLFNLFNNVETNTILTNNGKNPALYIVNTENANNDDFDTIEKIKNVKSFNKVIISNGADGYQVENNQLLLIGYVVKKSDKTTPQEKALKDYKSKYELATSVTIRDDIKIDDKKRLYGLDITKEYINKYTKKTKLIKSKNEDLNKLNTEINNMITEGLGMRPTIYNIFKILLNDVDGFFNKMYRLSNTAYQHHNNQNIKNQIINFTSEQNEGKDPNKTVIYPFPLIIDDEDFNCNKTKKVRVAPIKISEQIKSEFPELTFIKEFIKSFLDFQQTMKVFNLKNETTKDGVRVWRPIYPGDSKVDFSSHNPYDLNATGANFLDQIVTTILERFYMSSQSIYNVSFNNKWDTRSIDDSSKSKLYLPSQKNGDKIVKLISNIEANNVIESVRNEKFADLLKMFSDDMKNDINGFYDYIKTNVSEYYYQPSGITYNMIANKNEKEVYISKKEPDFEGFNILINPKELVIKDEDDLDFEQQYTTYKYIAGIFTTEDKIKDVKPTTENLLFSKDTGSEYVKSKYLCKRTENINENYPKIKYTNVLNVGNAYFTLNNIESNEIYDKYDAYGDFGYLWSYTLRDKYDDYKFMHDIVTGDTSSEYNKKRTLLVYLSNFGYSLSPFNTYPNKLNKEVFAFPMIVEIPAFVLYYMGFLLSVDEDFLKGISDKYFGYNTRILIFADYYDLKTSLSKRDQELLKKIYEVFYEQFADDLIDNIKKMLTTGKIPKNNEYEKTYKETFYTSAPVASVTQISKREKYFNDLLTDGGKYYKNITLILMNRLYLINLSELTFRFDKYLEQNEYYTLLGDPKYNNKISDDYFKNLFTYISNNMDDKVKELEKQNSKIYDKLNDPDIITQMYYSFKNINDKWVYNLCKDPNGYPFKNDRNKGLISQFAFVDRAMNPIGDDTIINPQVLIDLMNDTDVSVFSVISQLLSVNNFEFFPLQNFMAFKDGEWKDSFRVTNGDIEQQFPMFVCMYIGGTSNYPSDIDVGGEFDSDTIIDLDTVNVADFTGDCTKNNTNEKNDKKGTAAENIYDNVKAFKVCFGTQNQSMFQDIQIDSKEFPETNESIHILAQIAGDEGPSSPVPKGQNLYNLYESRAYKATVTGLGNATLQPTQYFQLTNIPMFNGAYMILTVEHNIDKNSMTTSFSGVKIHKYPMPRVKNAATIVGVDYKDMDTTITSKNESNNQNLNSAEVLNNNNSNDLKMS